jgi:DNA-binding NtrC family response regulator
MSIRVLVVVSAGPARSRLEAALRRRGHEVAFAGSATQALSLQASFSADALVAVLPLADCGAAQFTRELQNQAGAPVLILSGVDADVRSPDQAFDLGAFEYLEDISDSASELLATLGAAVGSRREDVQLRYFRAKDASSVTWAGLQTTCTSMQRVVTTLRQVCRRTSNSCTPTILLQGETGTGKSYIARCVHYEGARRNQAFVEINCATLPPTLMESELFGHERGAFTDAKAPRSGLFEAAHGGTLFLDEIASVPLDLQAKLLTAIEDKKVRRIGGRDSLQVNVQVVAATHEDLETKVRQGTFRGDLYHRLNVVAVTLPPLRERQEDALVFARGFVESICREYGIPPRELADDAREWIANYSWPGNVRELRNRIERILLLEDDEMIRAEHFGPLPSLPPESTIRVVRRERAVSVTLPDEGVPLEELELAVIREALRRCRGNVSQAARYLSISRQTLMYRMKKHSLDVRRLDLVELPELPSTRS